MVVSAKLLDAASVKLLTSFAHQDEVFQAEFSPDGARILTESVDKTDKLWDLTSGKLIASFDHPGGLYLPGIVSFGMPGHRGDGLVLVDTAAEVAVAPNTIWALCVPFNVSVSPVKIGSIFDKHDVVVLVGNYDLVFAISKGNTVKRQTDEEEYSYVIRLQFCSDEKPDFRILKKGNGVTTDSAEERRQAGLVGGWFWARSSLSSK